MSKNIKILISLFVAIAIIYGILFYLDLKSYNPANRPYIIVDDMPFNAENEPIIDQDLDSPEKLIDYVNSNLQNETIENKVIFVSKTLSSQGYESIIMKYISSDQKDYLIVIFRDNDLPKHITFDTKFPEILIHGWSFNELLESEEERLGIDIIKYSIFESNVKELNSLEWVNREI